jgi:hypothetical protein
MSAPWPSSTPIPQQIKRGTVADRVALFNPKTLQVPETTGPRPKSRTPSALKALTIDRDEHPDLGTREAFGGRREESFGTPATRAAVIGDDQNSLLNPVASRAGKGRSQEKIPTDVGVKTFPESVSKTATSRPNLPEYRGGSEDTKLRFSNAFKSFKLYGQRHEIQSPNGAQWYPSRAAMPPANPIKDDQKKTLGPVKAQESADTSLKSWSVPRENSHILRSGGHIGQTLQAANLPENQFMPKLRKDSRTLYHDKLRRLEERISVSPSISTSSTYDSSEVRTIFCSDGGDSEGDSEQESAYVFPKEESAEIQHCRPRIGRKPRFLTDDSIVEALERESPQLFSGPPESSKKVDHTSKPSARSANAAEKIKSRSMSTITTTNCTEQSKSSRASRSMAAQQKRTSNAHSKVESIRNQRLTSISSTSSQDIADQQRQYIDLSKQISPSPTPRPFEGLALRETLDSPDTAGQTPWRKSPNTIRSSLSMPRIKGSLSRGKSNSLAGNRKRSMANFFASINPPIRQWSFAERWGHSKEGKKQAEQSVQHRNRDGASRSGSRKQSVSDDIKSQRYSITDGSGRLRESSRERPQEKTCYVSFEEPRRLSRRIRRRSNAIPLRTLGSSSKSDEVEAVEYAGPQGRIRGLGVIVTLDGGAEVVVDARVSGREWNVKDKT